MSTDASRATLTVDRPEFSSSTGTSSTDKPSKSISSSKFYAAS